MDTHHWRRLTANWAAALERIRLGGEPSAEAVIDEWACRNELRAALWDDSKPRFHDWEPWVATAG